MENDLEHSPKKPSYAKFKGHHCFKDHWSGFDEMLPLNIIIGRNNTGKSHLLKFVEELTNKKYRDIAWNLDLKFPVTDTFLGNISNLGWSPDRFESIKDDLNGGSVHYVKESYNHVSFSNEITQRSLNDSEHAKIRDSIHNESWFNHKKSFKHILAERDIKWEPATSQVSLLPDGRGSTNIVRKCLISSERTVNRDWIQKEVLAALNEIFSGDGKFTEINVKHHDAVESGAPQDHWEIYLHQEHKGLVSLSNSGSGLKTIFLVLLHLIVIPHIENKPIYQYVFAFEELENNLHPAIFRNLLSYIKRKSASDPENGEHPYFFITTHSSVALDYFVNDRDAQIIHVTHDGKSAKTETINQSSELMSVLWDLGTRPSDLLQANGIIWVEGPSDRIYINKWIELLGEGKYQEGRHYQCAFYGGALLARLQAANDSDTDFVNLLKINPNVVVVSDSDRASEEASLKPRVERIKQEFDKLDAERTFHWVLKAREIENYLTRKLLREVYSVPEQISDDPDQYQSFFHKANDGDWYIKRFNKSTSIDKVELAEKVTAKMELTDLQGRFDLEESVHKILGLIERWNR